MLNKIFNSLRLVLALIALLPFLVVFRALLEIYQFDLAFLSLPKRALDYFESLNSEFFVSIYLLYLLSGVVFWHAVFWPIISGKSNSKALRTISKITDYCWYMFGASLVALIFHNAQLTIAQETKQIIQTQADDLKSGWYTDLDTTYSTCRYLDALESLDRVGVEWAQNVCNQHFLNKEDYEIDGIESTCVQLGMEDTFEPSNDPRFIALPNEDRVISDSLNRIHGRCYSFVKYYELAERIRELKLSENSMFNFSSQTGSRFNLKLLQFYLTFFTFFLGAKLTKTTVDSVAEWRKKM